MFFFFFKQKTAYEMRISDWSSDVCSSDLTRRTSSISTRRNAASCRSRGRLREGAESYAKDLGQRYSPVRLMCSHPNGETWASRSGSIWEIGRAHVCTPVTNAHLVCRLLLEKKKYNKRYARTRTFYTDNTTNEIHR